MANIGRDGKPMQGKGRRPEGGVDWGKFKKNFEKINWGIKKKKKKGK